MLRTIGQTLVFFLITITLTACSIQQEQVFTEKNIYSPANWDTKSKLDTVQDNWIRSMNIENIEELVAEAIKNNHSLKQLAYDVQIKQQELIISKSPLLPNVDLDISQEKKTTTQSSSSINSSSIQLGIEYEVDIWGKLSDAQKQTNLELLSIKATYEQAKQQLASDVIIRYLDIIESNELMKLQQVQINNINENKNIILSSYTVGLKSSLDVYTINKELNTKVAQFENQKNTSKEFIRELELLLGKYPKNIRSFNQTLPELNSQIKVGLPKELIKRKPSLLASWSQVLAFDSQLAFTHKQRLPSLKLFTSLKDSAQNVNELFSGVPLVWSLLGSISAPIFNAGELKAKEKEAFLRVQQAESKYLQDVYTAYLDVENSISQESSLRKQYEVILDVKKDATLSFELLKEQYYSGLVNYTEVLIAKQKVNEVQTTIIGLKKQLLENRIKLHLGLGGDFSTSQTQNKEIL